MSDLAFLSATELAAKVAAKEISAVELLQMYLQRVDTYNPDLNALCVDIRDQALADAEAADAALAQGQSLGAFHGVPMTVKESYNVAGTPTTWGNPDWRDNVTAEDAECVKKLKGAGVNVFGKTNVPLSLADFQSYNEIYGTTNNPYDHSRIPGGSSGGSAAALAAGLTGLEIGSDIGGSIRNPAHFCGVFGHKPTHDLLWMRGHSAPGDMRSTPDISVIGPLARSADDLYSAIKIMAGPDEIMSRGYQLNLPELGDRPRQTSKLGFGKTTKLRRLPKRLRRVSILWPQHCAMQARKSPRMLNLNLAPTTVTRFISASCMQPWHQECHWKITKVLKPMWPTNLIQRITAVLRKLCAHKYPALKSGARLTRCVINCAGAGTSTLSNMIFCLRP